mmetsp:Transcript_30425/g.78922  ORF Transcript_30425/g.78922 Transcript_30425/m.78922 type:complete len:81 (+) Transcript_30425:794-1036(+)
MRRRLRAVEALLARSDAVAASTAKCEAGRGADLLGLHARRRPRSDPRNGWQRVTANQSSKHLSFPTAALPSRWRLATGSL